jgi:hypothetical protein
MGYKKRDHENYDLNDAYKLLKKLHKDILTPRLNLH